MGKKRKPSKAEVATAVLDQISVPFPPPAPPATVRIEGGECILVRPGPPPVYLSPGGSLFWVQVEQTSRGGYPEKVWAKRTTMAAIDKVLAGNKKRMLDLFEVSDTFRDNFDHLVYIGRPFKTSGQRDGRLLDRKGHLTRYTGAYVWDADVVRELEKLQREAGAELKKVERKYEARLKKLQERLQRVTVHRHGTNNLAEMMAKYGADVEAPV